MIGGDLITYRPDIQVLDATIRDGGLVNDFYFTDEFIYLTEKTDTEQADDSEVLIAVFDNDFA